MDTGVRSCSTSPPSPPRPAPTSLSAWPSPGSSSTASCDGRSQMSVGGQMSPQGSIYNPMSLITGRCKRPIRGRPLDGAVPNNVRTPATGPLPFPSRRVLFPPRVMQPTSPMLMTRIVSPLTTPPPPPPPPSTTMDGPEKVELERFVAQANIRARPSARTCKFCKNNGESEQIYSSHVIRNPVTGALICPILRKHHCEICNATGDQAHTRNYCPVLKEAVRSKYIQGSIF